MKVDVVSVMALVCGDTLEVPVLSINEGHACLCPYSLGVRADSPGPQRGESIENHNTEKTQLVTCCNISEEKVFV